MKVWESDIGVTFADFLIERGVDLPRAWSLHCRQESSKGKNDNRLRTFMAFLIAEYPVQCAAWRVRGGGK